MNGNHHHAHNATYSVKPNWNVKEIMVEKGVDVWLAGWLDVRTVGSFNITVGMECWRSFMCVISQCDTIVFFSSADTAASS